MSDAPQDTPPSTDNPEVKNEMPLPWEFYNFRGWYDSMMKFYADDRKLMSREALDNPAKSLIVAIRDVIDVYGNFPDDTARALDYSINPLYEPGEYHKKVYEPLKKESLTKGDSNLMFMADGLLTIRSFFEKDEQFLQQRFEREIEHMAEGSEEEKFEKFASIMRDITKSHVAQITKMIRDFISNPNNG